MTISIATAKSLVWAALQALPGNTTTGPTATDAAPLLAQYFDPACQCHVFHPINEVHGTTAMNAQFWQPLLRAMPNLERRTHLFFAGEFDGRFCGGAGTWVTAHGYLCGTMVADWLGIPATGDTMYVRIGEFYRVQNTPSGPKIVDARILLDLVDVMRQAGYRVLPQSNGLEMIVPGPQQQDGLLLSAQDAQASIDSMASLDRMIGGLSSFNQKDLKSMGMHAFWHPEMMWYGPCGIGTSRQVEGFQKHHQKPFLHAFPDRVGGNHISRIAEGHYIASTGWPSVHATHAGDYLGAPAIHGPIHMRVADWWRREGDTLRENWVMIDLPDLLLQMGVDLFARLAEQVARQPPRVQ
jgi:SnoaL-like polyketide cyclase